MKDMKYLVIIIGLLCIANAFAQNQKTLTVIGECEKNVEIQSYTVNIEFREVVSDGYQNALSKSLDEIREEYKAMLYKVGINFDDFQENINYRLTATYYKTSAYYRYSTTSQEELKKIVSQGMKGVFVSWVDINSKDKTHEEIAILNEKALQDATKKASLIAKNINTKIKGIQHIKDNSAKGQYYDFHKMDKPQRHVIEVTFLLE